MDAKPLKGTCFCGRVEIEAYGDPLFRGRCHCTNCQRIHGAESVALVGFLFDKVKVTKGEGNLLKFQSTPKNERVFCKTCTSPMYSEFQSEDMHIKDFPLTILERDADGKIINLENLQPDHHIFYRSRVHDMKDGLKKYKGMLDEEMQE